MTKIGSIRVSDASEYGRPGQWVVEQYSYWGTGDLCWAVPGWVEDRFGVSGFFPSEREAREFLAMVTA